MDTLDNIEDCRRCYINKTVYLEQGGGETRHSIIVCCKCLEALGGGVGGVSP